VFFIVTRLKQEQF